MSSTTLLLAVTGGVFCSTSLIGAAMIVFLWVQATRSPHVPPPVQRPAVAGSVQTSSAVRQTLPPGAVAAITAVPELPPAPFPGNAQPRTWLDGVGGMIAGQRIMIEGPHILIGRSGVCNIQFHDPKISRQHAILRLIDGYYQIEDMRSTGGTYVNGQSITVHRLRDRDQLRLGDSVLVFRQH